MEKWERRAREICGTARSLATPPLLRSRSKPMNFKRWVKIGVVGALGVGLGARSCASRGNYFASIGVQVPNSAIVSHQSFPSLTGNEDIIALKMSPAQITATLKQFRTKSNYGLSAPGKIELPLTGNGSADASWKKFLSGVPPRIQNGYFEIHRGPEDNTLCWFYLDKPTGRVWFYGWDVYN